MRRSGRLLLLAAAGLLAGCAHIEPPPGGPEDREPPRLIATRPDTMARVDRFSGPAVLVFDEPLSEREVETAVMVSPRTSTPEVSKRGDELRVTLRRGWEPGRIYQVTVQPALQDLFGNRLAAPVRLVFSTGPEIPDTRLAGRVSDRVTGQPEKGIRVEAILTPDSLVYATLSDSAGGFLFRQVPAGTYRVRAYRDPNANRELDAFEPRDTATATLAAGSEATVALRVLQPDTSPPMVASVQVAGDSLVEVKLDDPLDPTQRVAADQVSVLLPDGTPLPVAEVRIGREGAAGADAPQGAQRELLPSTSLFIRTARPLPPETELRVAVRGVVNLHGLAGGGEASVRTPAAPRRAEGEAAPPPPPP